jgi:error-prone DNA polymerase
MFLLFEDEFGTVNLIVPKAVYDRHRNLARAEPLLLARGRLERWQEGAPPSVLSLREARIAHRQEQAEEQIKPVINVLVRELAPLERYLPGGVGGAEEAARVHHLPGSSDAPGSAPAEAEEDVQGTEVGSSMRAAVPPMQSFGGGRRR